jgi:hypothetical protein
MTPFCQPLPPSVGQDMLQIAAKAICDHAGDKPFLRESRTRQMVYSVMGFEPRDGHEYMLATLIVGHYHLILNSMREVFQGQMDTMMARTKSGIVSLDRAMLAFGREMREAQRRPVAREAEDARRQTEAALGPGPVEVAAWVADWSGMPPVAPDTMAASSGATPGAASGEPVVTVGSRPVETAAARPVAPLPAPAATRTSMPVANARNEAAQAAARPADPTRNVTSAPADANRGVAGPMSPAPRPLGPGAAGVNRPALMSSAAHLPPNDVDDETLRHIAEFEAALATLTDTLEETRALDGGKTGTKAASGD